MAVDRAGNRRRSAKHLGKLTGLKQVNDRLGGDDRVDMYDFRVGQSSRVILKLSRFRFNANMALLDKQGQVIERSHRPGRRPEKIKASLEPGRYFVRVWTRDRTVRDRTMPYRLRLRSRLLPASDLPAPDLPAPDLSAPNPPIAEVPVSNTPTLDPAPDIPTSAPPVSQPLVVSPPTSTQSTRDSEPPARPDLVRYDFEYHYKGSTEGVSSDRYQGYVIAEAQTYAMGWHDPRPEVTELGFNGQYQITAIRDYDDSNQQDADLVYVSRYTDVNNGSEQFYTPYYQSQGLPSGRRGLGSELDFIDLFHPHHDTAPQRQFGQDRYAADPALTQISDVEFNGQEGGIGHFRIRLTRPPQSRVTLTFIRNDSDVTIDADGQIQNGIQDTLTFTRDSWNQPKTVAFVAEVDDSDQDRPAAQIRYVLSDGLAGSETYTIGPIQNTDSPDPTRYNIDFDFRADHLGFWTPARRRVLRQAADDWSSRVAADLPGFWLNEAVSLKHPTRNDLSGAIALESNRYVDDLVIFAGAYDAEDGAGAWAGVQIEAAGLSNDLPRVSMLTINQRYAVDYSEANLYWLMSHEIGHTLGLIRQSQAGRDLIDNTSPETAVFRGRYARAANGDRNVPLQSQDGPNPITGHYDYGHPADAVDSILGYTQRASQPTAIDYAMLADIGYSVYGVNA
ncbi:MAG: hypothetical protein ACFB4J_20165 [Elainellaceae cyanobacterium]